MIWTVCREIVKRSKSWTDHTISIRKKSQLNILLHTYRNINNIHYQYNFYLHVSRPTSKTWPLTSNDPDVSPSGECFPGGAGLHRGLGCEGQSALSWKYTGDLHRPSGSQTHQEDQGPGARQPPRQWERDGKTKAQYSKGAVLASASS